MKVLTVRQPYASLIIEGIKQYETRTWQISWPKIIAIHAAITASPNDRIWDLVWDRYRWLPTHLEYGVILGTVSVTGCKKCNLLTPTELEDRLGHWDGTHYAWQLSEPHAYVQPVHARGKLSLWTYP